MKSFWFKNSTFTFCVWVLGQVDHCDENFWIVKYSKICSYFSSVTKWCNFKRLQDISIYVCLFADLKMKKRKNLQGKKCTALFHTHNWEKSSFFNALVRVFAQIYANTWQGGHNVPYPGPNRVNFNDVPLVSKDGPQ